MKAKTKKYIAVSVMVLVAAMNIPQLAGLIPAVVKSFAIAGFGINMIGAVLLLLSAWWVGNKEVD